MTQKQNIWHVFWRFMRPDIEEFTSYVLISLAIVGIAIYQLVVNGKVDTDSTIVTTSLNQAISGVMDFVSQGGGWARFFLFGFWFIIGGISYSIVWAITTLLVDIHNDIETSATFVHPKSFRQSDFWASIIARGLLRTSAAITLVFYGVYWVWVVVPLCIAITERLFTNFYSITNVSSALLATAGLFLTLHVGAILLRLVLLRPSR